MEAMLGLATISLDPSTIELIGKETGVAMESVAEFYSGTPLAKQLRKELGQQIFAQARQEGRQEGHVGSLTAALHVRFGDQARIPALAERLARAWDTEASMRIAMQAESLDDLLAQLPPTD
jgi:hypothetical protein